MSCLRLGEGQGPGGKEGQRCIQCQREWAEREGGESGWRGCQGVRACDKVEDERMWNLMSETNMLTCVCVCV
jgi:hypothetical protein